MANMIGVNDESAKFIEAYAKRRDLGKGEAADKLLSIAKSRLNATEGYYHRQHDGGKPKAKPAKAKKPAAKAKAKRSTRSKKEAPAAAVAATA